MGGGNRLSDFLPLVDGLADCVSHEERANWLLCCPLAILNSESMAIRALCQAARFIPGVAYVETEQAALRSTRNPNGTLKPGVQRMVDEARGALAAFASRPLIEARA